MARLLGELADFVPTKQDRGLRLARAVRYGGVMMVVVFRSRLREEAREAYAARELEAYGWAEKMPGFVASKDFVAEDGERLALIEFRSAEELQAWREHDGHRVAQQQGRDEFYAEYRLQVCELVRESRFERSRGRDKKP